MCVSSPELYVRLANKAEDADQGIKMIDTMRWACSGSERSEIRCLINGHGVRSRVISIYIHVLRRLTAQR